jgi:hypothetical protein
MGQKDQWHKVADLVLMVLVSYGSREGFHPMSTTSERLTANEAKSAIYDLADDFSWETVAKEMVARMSGDEARDFLSDFKRLYAN